MSTASIYAGFKALLPQGVEFENEYDGRSVLQRKGSIIYEYDTRWPESITETNHPSEEAVEKAAWMLCKMANVWTAGCKSGSGPQPDNPRLAWLARLAAEAQAAAQPQYWPVILVFQQ